MARPINNGLEYFPLDTDFFDDPKLMHVEEECGMDGSYIALRLYCWIYRDGYFMPWDEDVAVIFARRIGLGIGTTKVNEVVEILVKREVFNSGLYTKYKILTSRGIQNRWLKIIKDAKRKANIDPLHDLVNIVNSVHSELIPKISEETNPIAELIVVKEEETTPITELSTQRKGKERKEKERKKSALHDPFLTPSLSEIQNHLKEKYVAGKQAAEIFAEKFFNHYSKEDWKVKGGSQMKDWKAAISGTWKKDVVALMEEHPKSKELEELELAPEVLVERKRRKSQYDNAIFGNSYLTGKPITFSDQLSIYHKKLGHFDELKTE